MYDLIITPTLVSINLLYHSHLFVVLMCSFNLCIFAIINRRNVDHLKTLWSMRIRQPNFQLFY